MGPRLRGRRQPRLAAVVAPSRRHHAPPRPTASASRCSAPARWPGSSTSSRAHGLDKKANLADRDDRTRLDRGRQDRHQGRLGRPDAVGLAVGRARALARRQARVLSVVQHARRRDGAGAIRPIKDIADLKGKKLAIAGGPLDKSWLLLQGLARRSGLDLRRQATIVYGAPPLLSEKAVQGENDATLTFWNFCADLEGKGQKRAIVMDEVMKQLGAKGAGRDRRLHLRRRLGGARTSRRSIASSTRRARPRRSWPRPTPNGSGSRRASACAIRRRSRSTASATAKASCAARSPRRKPMRARSIGVLAEVGGTELVGPARELDRGTFYRPGGVRRGIAGSLSLATAARRLVRRRAVRGPAHAARPADGRARDRRARRSPARSPSISA